MHDSRLRSRAGYPDGSSSVRDARSLRIVHSVGRTDVHTLYVVGARVQGDGDASVSHEVLDVLWVLACHEEYCSAGVAEVLGVDLGQIRHFRVRPKLVAEHVDAA